MSPVRCPSCREVLDASDRTLVMDAEGAHWHRGCAITTISLHAQATEFRGAMRPMTCPCCADLVKPPPQFYVDDLGHPWHAECVTSFLATVAARVVAGMEHQ